MHLRHLAPSWRQCTSFLVVLAIHLSCTWPHRASWSLWRLVASCLIHLLPSPSALSLSGLPFRMALPGDCGEGLLLAVDSHRAVPAPFLTKTYQLVDDPATDDIVSWGEDNTTFVVWRPPEFARDLLPNYFKHNNFSSFVRQLNTYGFRKIVPDRWEFANEHFRRGEKQLLCEIHRRKTSTHATAVPGTLTPAQPLASRSHSPSADSADDGQAARPWSPSLSSPLSSPRALTASATGSFSLSVCNPSNKISEENEQLRRDNNALVSEMAKLRRLYDDMVVFVQQHLKPEQGTRSRMGPSLPGPAHSRIAREAVSISGHSQPPLLRDGEASAAHPKQPSMKRSVPASCNPLSSVNHQFHLRKAPSLMSGASLQIGSHYDDTKVHSHQVLRSPRVITTPEQLTLYHDGSAAESVEMTSRLDAGKAGSQFEGANGGLASGQHSEILSRSGVASSRGQLSLYHDGGAAEGVERTPRSENERFGPPYEEVTDGLMPRSTRVVSAPGQLSLYHDSSVVQRAENVSRAESGSSPTKLFGVPITQQPSGKKRVSESEVPANPSPDSSSSFTIASRGQEAFQRSPPAKCVKTELGLASVPWLLFCP